MPRVTVIIPVYKAEQYLHACLDSVLNQTLTDIRVICVDDGSPDRCPQILDDYAAKDNRVTVIHQQNGGISAARTAAYPYIKSDYTLFVDDDDLIEPDLCEKAVALADSEQADVTYFFYNREFVMKKQTWKRSLKCPFTELNNKALLSYMMVWTKLWRSRFLLDNDIRCPAGPYHDDLFIQWKTFICNPKSVLLPKVMYHYRIHPASTFHEPSKKYLMKRPATFDLIKKMLVETGNYDGEWKKLFLHSKLEGLRKFYHNLPKDQKIKYLHMIKDSFGTDEQEYLLHGSDLKRQVRIFYYSLFGSRLAAAENTVYILLRKAEEAIRICRNKIIETLFVGWF
ncbi:MAG: glycosyltransferase [Planctomycetaceae bacterium]|nr:glycosyltransferase [Planctomycetaceae bacterium]